jgi:hypothetical protein
MRSNEQARSLDRALLAFPDPLDPRLGAVILVKESRSAHHNATNENEWALRFRRHQMFTTAKNHELTDGHSDLSLG